MMENSRSNEAWACAVRDCEAQRYNAILEPDLASLDQLFDDRLVYTHSSGIVDTKASYLRAIADGRLNYRRASVDIQQLFTAQAGCDDVVVCMGRVSLIVDVDHVPMKLVNQGTGLWVRTGDRFKLVAFQATPVRHTAP